MVFVLFGNSEEYKSEAEPAGYWVDMFPDDEEYTLSPDPDGHYISYERIDERTGKNVRYMQKGSRNQMT